MWPESGCVPGCEGMVRGGRGQGAETVIRSVRVRWSWSQWLGGLGEHHWLFRNIDAGDLGVPTKRRLCRARDPSPRLQTHTFAPLHCLP